MATTIPRHLRDEFAILKMLVIAVIAGSVTWVFLAVAAGYISESTVIINQDGTIEVRNNTAVAVGIALFNAMAGGGIALLFQEKLRKSQSSSSSSSTSSTEPSTDDKEEEEEDDGKET